MIKHKFLEVLIDASILLGAALIFYLIAILDNNFSIGPDFYLVSFVIGSIIVGAKFRMNHGHDSCDSDILLVAQENPPPYHLVTHSRHVIVTALLAVIGLHISNITKGMYIDKSIFELVFRILEVIFVFLYIWLNTYYAMKFGGWIVGRFDKRPREKEVRIEWSVLHTFYDSMSANALVGRLSIEGLPVKIESNSPIPGLNNDYKVLVPSTCLQRAREIIFDSQLDESGYGAPDRT